MTNLLKTLLLSALLLASVSSAQELRGRNQADAEVQAEGQTCDATITVKCNSQTETFRMSVNSCEEAQAIGRQKRDEW